MIPRQSSRRLVGPSIFTLTGLAMQCNSICTGLRFRLIKVHLFISVYKIIANRLKFSQKFGTRQYKNEPHAFLLFGNGLGNQENVSNVFHFKLGNSIPFRTFDLLDGVQKGFVGGEVIGDMGRGCNDVDYL